MIPDRWAMFLHEITFFQIWSTLEEIKKASQSMACFSFYFDFENFFLFYFYDDIMKKHLQHSVENREDYMKRILAISLFCVFLCGCRAQPNLAEPANQPESQEVATVEPMPETSAEEPKVEVLIDPYILPESPEFWSEVLGYVEQIHAAIAAGDPAPENLSQEQALAIYQKIIFENFDVEFTYYYPEYKTGLYDIYRTDMGEIIAEECWEEIPAWGLWKFTLVDLNRDGNAECILQPPWDRIYILRATEDDAFIYDWVFRGMNPLYKDGTMGGSSGAASNHYDMIRFTERGYITTNLLYIDSNYSPFDAESLALCQSYALEEWVDLTMAIGIRKELLKEAADVADWYTLTEDGFLEACREILAERIT